MTSPEKESLLERLAKAPATPADEQAWAEVAATRPRDGATPDDDEKLAGLLGRIQQLAQGKAPADSKGAPPASRRTAPDGKDAAGGAPSAPSPPAGEPADADEWIPLEKNSFREMELTDSEVESLVLKFLLSRGDAPGREIADQVRLPFMLIENLLRDMKLEQLVVYRGTSHMNDYVYQLSDLGRERARRYVEHCTYFGAAPVSLKEYIASVKAQSLGGQNPTPDDLRRAFSDLLINPRMLSRLGPAINSGKGLFLYGFPGNGKTSIAKRVTRSFGQYIWVPQAIGIDGEIMRLFDPMNHEEAPLPKSDGLLDQSRIDRRWVRIRRPTIVVGGELTMDHLEVVLNTATGIMEAPLQMKSNCGTLVIDDFGRQRMGTDELLNRWIVPLEERIDFLNLASGKSIQVPFDQLIVFSTNLEPRDLVDEAFLRRIPYKIEVQDPSEDEFRKLFQMMADQLGIEYRESVIDYVIEKHFRKVDRPFRACQPRDLLLQVRNLCRYEQKSLEMTNEYFDYAAENYFAVM